MRRAYGVSSVSGGYVAPRTLRRARRRATESELAALGGRVAFRVAVWRTARGHRLYLEADALHSPASPEAYRWHLLLHSTAPKRRIACRGLVTFPADPRVSSAAGVAALYRVYVHEMLRRIWRDAPPGVPGGPIITLMYLLREAMHSAWAFRPCQIGRAAEWTRRLAHALRRALAAACPPDPATARLKTFNALAALNPEWQGRAGSVLWLVRHVLGVGPADAFADYICHATCAAAYARPGSAAWLQLRQLVYEESGLLEALRARVHRGRVPRHVRRTLVPILCV